MRNSPVHGIPIPVIVLAVSCQCAIWADETSAARGKAGWPRFGSPEEAGFDSGEIAEAKAYFDQLQPAYASSVTIYKGRLLLEWGKSKRNYYCHSVRKSFLSALIGIHVDEGSIDMDKTIEELGIDDIPPSLTEAEKQAKVVHLIKSRSGVYHEAAAETPEMEALRPPRGSHGPDEFFYYNNWDFNALGTIFRQETGKDIYQEFKARIADRIGMQDFDVKLCSYEYELDKSIHPAYTFWMSARDRARFGLLFLNKGNWRGEQIVSEKWVKESTKTWSNASMGVPELAGYGFGYMWKTFSRKFRPLAQFEHLRGHAGYAASGYRGHAILVIPDLDLVHVVVPDTLSGYEVTLEESGKLLNMIMGAKFKEINDLRAVALNVGTIQAVPGGTIRATVHVLNDGDDSTEPTDVMFYLSKDTTFSVSDLTLGAVAIEPISANKKGKLIASIPVPSTVQPGVYHLIAVIDPDNKNDDPILENNITASTKTISLKLLSSSP
ncbi:MAG: serine hydrolase [Acidobacteriota bacterium]